MEDERIREAKEEIQANGMGRKLIEMAIDYAQANEIGTGNNLGEFTLFANIGADKFYENRGVPGFCLDDGDFGCRWRGFLLFSPCRVTCQYIDCCNENNETESSISKNSHSGP